MAHPHFFKYNVKDVDELLTEQTCGFSRPKLNGSDMAKKHDYHSGLKFLIQTQKVRYCKRCDSYLFSSVTSIALPPGLRS